MKASDANQTGTCQNCGAEHRGCTDMEICHECCDHENTEEELTRTTCLDCGAGV